MILVYRLSEPTERCCLEKCRAEGFRELHNDLSVVASSMLRDGGGDNQLEGEAEAAYVTETAAVTLFAISHESRVA